MTRGHNFPERNRLQTITLLDVWRYIAAERLEVPRIYFAHPRRAIERDGMRLEERGRP